MKPSVTAGTEIRDDDGNLIATWARDMFPGSAVTVDSLRFEGKTPKVGEPMHPAIRKFLGSRYT